MHSFQPQPRQRGGRTPLLGGTEPSLSLEMLFHLPETAKGCVLTDPSDVPAGPGVEDGTHRVREAG